MQWGNHLGAFELTSHLQLADTTSSPFSIFKCSCDCRWRSKSMEWIVSSQDEATGRISETRYTTEASFHAALRDMFSDIKNRFLTAELADGKVLDEDSARELVGAPHGSSWG
jgi:hypothetical protein